MTTAASKTPDRLETLAGLLAGLTAALIWAGWIVATRQASAAAYGVALTPVDVGILRFGAPALLLAPFWLSAPGRGDIAGRGAPGRGDRPGRGDDPGREALGGEAPEDLRRRSGPGSVGRWLGARLKPAGVSWGLLFGLFLWGAPFVIFAALGAARGDTVIFSALVPGSMPLYAAGLAFLLHGERPGRERRLGLALLLAAAGLTLIARGGGAALWASAPYYVAASICWAAYAVAFRRAGLSATRAAGLVAGLSLILLVPAALIAGSQLGRLSAGALAWQILAHGVLSGAVAVIAYGMALERLGPSAAAFAALVPPLAALIGWAWLGEAPGWLGGAAMLLAGAGVALANGALRRRSPAAPAATPPPPR